MSAIPETKSKFSVILKADLPPLEREFFSHYTRRLQSESGREMLLFACTSIDTTHHYYLAFESFLPGEEAADSLMIPHQYVFAILGGDYDDGRLRVGFTSEP